MTTATEEITASPGYRGRRRRPVPPARRRLVAVATALLTAVLLVVMGHALTPGREGHLVLLPRPDPTADRSGGEPNRQPSEAALRQPVVPSPHAGRPPGSTATRGGASVLGSPSVEAEGAGAVRSGGTKVRTVAGASGGRVVAHLANGKTVRFTGISVPAAGRYALTIHYVAGARRSGVVLVNGRAPVVPAFAVTRDWQTVGSVTVPVLLSPGANTVEIGNPAGWAPDIDRIVLADSP